MKTKSTRTALLRLFEDAGYTRGRGGVYTQNSAIVFVVDPGTSRRNGLFSISSGIWLRDIGETAPDRFWQFHIYGNIQCMVPADIADLGTVSAKIDQHQLENLACNALRIIKYIGNMSSTDMVRTAYFDGVFDRCMVTKSAREHLLA